MLYLEYTEVPPHYNVSGARREHLARQALDSREMWV